ncbi:DNA N-glycosylase and apurinic/apyrimidinic (AP) lyase [Mortierella antarctica]|nr:DNA N-glycosylase and apurinic/apyrimidinic (AP) lyase [Mortierella antarctica]
MSTRASSRLRDARIKTETDPTPPLTSASIPLVVSSRRSTRTSCTIVKNEDGDLDETTLARLKLEADEHRQALAAERRKAATTAASPARKRTVKEEEPENGSPGVAKKSKYATKEPVGWETTLDRIRAFRLENPAPVDTMGCERLAEVGDHIPPEVSRFQTLMALVLSSQTKDTVTSVAVRRLQRELKGGLTIQGVLDVPNEELNTMIGAVGFHNKKTIYMKQVAEICRTQYKGDIPDTAEGLMALPGVGPKMAYLTLQCAWNKNLGIGVDTHVHRIANRLGWIKTEKDGPEATREALQSWLPKAHWREINYVLVGFGQVLCLPRGPLCGECPVRDRCPSAMGVNKRRKVKIEIKDEILEQEVNVAPGAVAIHSIHKTEDVNRKVTTVKEEEEESPYFATSHSETADVVKTEPDDKSTVQLLNEDGEISKSNLMEESADIEDLVQ